jgi:hypothetical protein
MDITVLQKEFPVSDEPGLSTYDERLGEISDLAASGDFLGAAEQVEALLHEDICDMRLVGYLAYGAFLERGLGAMTDIFESLAAVLETSWEAFGPKAQRAKAAQTALTWFTNQALRTAQREESGKGPAWDRWTSQVTVDDVDVMVRRLMRLQGAVDERLGNAGASVLDTMSKLRGFIDGFRASAHYPEPEPEPEPVVEEVEEVPEVETQAVTVQTSQQAQPVPQAISGSHHLALLLKKLDAFAKLVESESFSRALIIADDVNQTLEQFDPMLYFPEFFKLFAKLQALHATDLIQFAEYRDSPEWRALQVLYRVDVDEFVNLS